MISIGQSRTYNDSNDTYAKTLLSSLLDGNNDATEYQNTMFDIGMHLGNKLKSDLDRAKQYCIVATAEDADYLAKGVMESLKNDVSALYLTCFWNDRIVVNNRSVAPIYNRYVEDGYNNADGLIVVKSIMSGSCVVKTNITALYDKVLPESIYVVSPVMHVDSEKKLEKEFPQKISNMFKYTFLAVDSMRSEDGEVIPGIGGSVYEKLGFKNQQDKNTFIPEIVKTRMFS